MTTRLQGQDMTSRGSVESTNVINVATRQVFKLTSILVGKP